MSEGKKKDAGASHAKSDASDARVKNEARIKDAQKKAREEASREYKKSNYRENSDGSYNVDGDRAEREGAKEQVRAKAKSRNTPILNDDDDDGGDDPVGIVDKLKDASWGDILKIGGAIFTPLIILGTVGGCAVGSAMSSAPVEDKPAVARNIEGVHGILDDVESLKDKQILSKSKQIGSMKEKGKGGLSKQEFGGLARLNDDVVETLDPFFEAIIGIKKDASGAELDNAQRQVSKRVTDRASTSELYDFLRGSSPAKQLNEQVSKAGPVMASWIGSGKNQVRTYTVIVPLVTESGTLKAEYLVTLDKNKQIDKIEYLGLLFDGTKPIESALARQLTGSASKSGEKASDVVGGSGSRDKQSGSRGSGSERGEGESRSSDSDSDASPPSNDRPVEGNVLSS